MRRPPDCSERIRAIPIEDRDTWGDKLVRNHCHQCGGDYDLRRIRMAYSQVNQEGETTWYAGYCGDCRMRDRLTGKVIRGEMSRAQAKAEWTAYCQRR